MEQCSNDRLTRIGIEEYASAQNDLSHIFLAGNLSMPSPHPFIRDRRLEIIVCNYHSGDDGVYHWHREVTEYELVIDGEIGYFEVGSRKTHWFEKGDFILIPSGVCVRRLVRQFASTIAVKVPSAAEKVRCAQCDRVCSLRIK